jgi:phosphoenolpyruvate phosphomutase
VLVHSKQKTPDEVEAFVRAWNGAVPIALVPTAYPEMDEKRILALGGKVGLVIYGNHAIRAAVHAMQKVFAMIRAERGMQGAESEIASVQEIFRLQNMDGVKADERKFLR